MSNPYSRLGVRNDDVLGQKMAAQFERQARAANWSQAQIDNAIKTCAVQEQNYMQMSVEDAYADWESRQSHLLTDAQLNFSVGWITDYAEHGLEGMPQPSEQENASRLHELDAMSGDPEGPYYKSAEAEALQREHLMLLEGNAGEIDDAAFESAASAASETLDGDVNDNAFDDNAADMAAEGDDYNG